MNATDFTMRNATPDDAELITEHRISMFKETRPVPLDTEAALRASCRTSCVACSALVNTSAGS